ncbi:11217_t:CDS:2 [Entrophospora sp. SA101]|nr:11217_t:CDS:2 [Entrophospora sp. SA101]
MEEDLDFFHLLEELRFGHPPQKSELLINEKVEGSQNSRVMISTTHVVGTCEISD